MKSLVQVFGLTILALLPALGLADDGGAFSLGGVVEQPKPTLYNYARLNLGYVSHDNFQFSRYRDLTDQGFYGSGDLLWDKINASKTASWTLDIKNLGLHNQTLNFAWRSSNNLRFNVAYSEMPLHRNDTGRTPYTGYSRLVLPATWTAGVDTSNFSLSQVTHPIDNQVLRKTLKVDIDRMFTSGLRLGASASVEKRTGTMLKGVAIYSNAANPQAVVLPAPIDEQTTVVRVRAGYNGRRLVVETRATYTHFDDNIHEVTWQNPYASGLGPNVDYPNGIGGYATPPDYDLMSYSLSSGYMFSEKVRMTLDAMTSETKQKDSLIGYTVNPLLTVTTPPPVDSIDGKLKTNMFNLALLTRPMARMTVNVRYRYNQRDNEEGRYAWQYVRGDGFDQQGPDTALFNRPLDYQRDLYSIEGRYWLPNSTRLGLTYDYTRTDRNYAAVSETKQDTYIFTIAPKRSTHFSHRLEFTVADLAGSTYEWSRSFFEEYAVSLIDQIPDDQRWTEHPLLRQYQLANQEKAALKWTTSWFPNDKWVVQGILSGQAVRFDKSELGLTDVHSIAVNLSAEYTPNNTYNSWVWVGYNRDRRDQMGRDFLGGINKPANQVQPPFVEGSDPSRNFQVQQGDESWSAGVGLNWKISDKWSMKESDTLLWAVTRYDVTTYGAPDLAGNSFPNTDNRMLHLKTQVDYSLSDRWVLTLAHEYFRYTDNSWQYQDVAIGDINKLLTTGLITPNETVNMVTLSTSYKF